MTFFLQLNNTKMTGGGIFRRITIFHDLVAEETVYHSVCMAKFCKKTDFGKFGRPINEEK